MGVGAVIDLDFVSVHTNAKNRAMSIKQAWSIFSAYTVEPREDERPRDRILVAHMRFGISRLFSLYFIIIIIMYHSIPKQPAPPPRGGAYPGHLTGVLLRTVLDPK